MFLMIPDSPASPLSGTCSAFSKELIPIVLAGYEVYGVQHFGAYGFDNRIEHPQLRNVVDMQKQGF